MIRTFPLLTILALGTGVSAIAQVYIADNFSITTATVTIAGDVHSTADISGNGLLLLNGTASHQSVYFDGHTIPVLEVNNARGILLGEDVRIIQELRLTGGKIRLGGATLAFESGAVVTGAGTDRYIVTDGNGMVTVENISTGSAFMFPVGKSDAAGDYTPAGITNQTVARSVSVRVQDYTSAPVAVPSPDQGIDRAWQIWSDVAGDATIALTHNASTEGAAFNKDSAYVTRQQAAGAWSTGIPSSGTNGGFTHSGNFSLPATAGLTAWFTKAAQAPSSITQIPALSIHLDVVPNPFVQDAHLQVVTGTAQQVQYILTDIAGKLITHDALQLPPGISRWPLPVAGLMPGVYLLHIAGNHMDRHMRIIRQ